MFHPLPPNACQYLNVPGEEAARLEALLLQSIASPQEATRLAAASWAHRLLPFSCPSARYISILAAGDAKLDVREAGAMGLQLPQSGAHPTPSACLMSHANTKTQELVLRCLLQMYFAFV